MRRGKYRNRKKSLDLSSVGEKTPSAPSSGDEKKRRSRRKAKIALTEPEPEPEMAPTLDPAVDFIDLTHSTPVSEHIDLTKSTPPSGHIELSNDGDANENVTTAESSKQAADRSPDAKGKSRELSFEIDTNPAPVSDYHPSAFTPMKSLLSSFKANIDDVDGEPVEDGEVIEATPSAPKEMRFPQGKNKKPILIDIDVEPHPETEAKVDGEKAKQQEEEHAGDKSGLLLPEHVRLMDSDEEDDPIEDSFVGPQDGVHVVDDHNAKVSYEPMVNKLTTGCVAVLQRAGRGRGCIPRCC